MARPLLEARRERKEVIAVVLLTPRRLIERKKPDHERHGKAAGQMLVYTYGRAKAALQAVDQQIAAPR